ncbi:LuxR C-terminal-related transcriptional regulator [[Enterobacter] lignolyticus]|nr:LuxR C-terminal-related transcriptional regulator [[Enterobacter] lignolyticus]
MKGLIDMLSKTDATLHCISCECHCQLAPEHTLRSHYCDSASFSVWPEKNIYFRKGVAERILKHHHNLLTRGFVFVDFSLPNLRNFLSNQWINNLSNANVNIILIADNRMRALANYWLKESDRIRAVIYNDDKHDLLNTKMRRIFSGMTLYDKKTPILNHVEFTILKCILDGKSAPQVSAECNINIKAVYVHKQRLEKKIGLHIYKIINTTL